MGVAGAVSALLDPSIRQVVEKADRFLRTARAALEIDDPESAASRAYYALYHMTILLLQVVRDNVQDRWDHEQLRRAFLEEFCKPHFKFSHADGDDWLYVRDMRIAADYSRTTEVNHRRAQRSIEKAQGLIAKMKMEVGVDA